MGRPVKIRAIHCLTSHNDCMQAKALVKAPTLLLSFVDSSVVSHKLEGKLDGQWYFRCFVIGCQYVNRMLILVRPQKH